MNGHLGFIDLCIYLVGVLTVIRWVCVRVKILFRRFKK